MTFPDEFWEPPCPSGGHAGALGAWSPSGLCQLAVLCLWTWQHWLLSCSAPLPSFRWLSKGCSHPAGAGTQGEGAAGAGAAPLSPRCCFGTWAGPCRGSFPTSAGVQGALGRALQHQPWEAAPLSWCIHTARAAGDSPSAGFGKGPAGSNTQPTSHRKNKPRGEIFISARVFSRVGKSPGLGLEESPSHARDLDALTGQGVGTRVSSSCVSRGRLQQNFSTGLKESQKEFCVVTGWCASTAHCWLPGQMPQQGLFQDLVALGTAGMSLGQGFRVVLPARPAPPPQQPPGQHSQCHCSVLCPPCVPTHPREAALPQSSRAGTRWPQAGPQGSSKTLAKPPAGEVGGTRGCDT